MREEFGLTGEESAEIVRWAIEVLAREPATGTCPSEVVSVRLWYLELDREAGVVFAEDELRRRASAVEPVRGVTADVAHGPRLPPRSLIAPRTPSCGRGRPPPRAAVASR